MDDALRWKAFEMAAHEMSRADIDRARAERKMALSLKVQADLVQGEIRHAAVKIVFPDRSEQTLLFDPVSARVLSEALARFAALGWRDEGLRPKGPAH